MGDRSQRIAGSEQGRAPGSREEKQGLGLLGNKTWDEVKFRRAKPG